jgi:hypothetical protein
VGGVSQSGFDAQPNRAHTANIGQESGIAMALQTLVEIKQSDLKQIYDLQSEIADKQLTLDQLIETVKHLKIAKAPVENGRFYPVLTWRTMHQVPWKQVVIERLGLPYAEAVRKATPTVRRPELRVVEHAIPPLWKQFEPEMTE